MGYYTFRWPHPANEVYVTGTFDNWGQSVKLDKTDSGFSKRVELPQGQKYFYKFVVDGNWTTDPSEPTGDDGHGNLNHFLLPQDIAGETVHTMSGVAPDSTTAALAGEVPKENGPTTNGPGAYTISSAAPDSTTAQLAKDVPLEGKSSEPGMSSEPEFSVKPIPATAGVGNPVHLQPGEAVPDPSTITNNTVESTATTDQAAYEKGASDPGMAAQAAAAAAPPKDDEFRILPIPGQYPKSTDTVPTLQSVAPESTTAGLAGAVPLETTKTTDPSVPPVVKDSIEKAHTEPEAAASQEAVKEKQEVERELLKEVPTKDDVGTPAPVTSAATAETAPAPTDTGDVSPKTKPAQPGTEQPTATTGPETTTAPTKSGSESGAAADTTAAPAAATGAEGDVKAKRRKSRMSGFFSKLKEKMK